MAEIAIKMDIGASSVKNKCTGKNWAWEKSWLYIHSQIFYEGQKDIGIIEKSEVSVCQRIKLFLMFIL